MDRRTVVCVDILGDSFKRATEHLERYERPQAASLSPRARSRFW